MSHVSYMDEFVKSRVCIYVYIHVHMRMKEVVSHTALAVSAVPAFQCHAVLSDMFPTPP